MFLILDLFIMRCMLTYLHQGGGGGASDLVWSSPIGTEGLQIQACIFVYVVMLWTRAIFSQKRINVFLIAPSGYAYLLLIWINNELDF